MIFYIFFLMNPIVVLTAMDICKRCKPDKLLINGGCHTVIYANFNSSVQFSASYCNGSSLDERDSFTWTKIDGINPAKILKSSNSSEFSINRIGFEQSSYIRVNNDKYEGYLKLIVCPQMDSILASLTVNCTVRSIQKYSYVMTCSTHHNWSNPRDCLVEISNFTIGYGKEFAVTKNSCTSSNCTFKLCPDKQNCDLNIMALHKKQFTIRMDVAIHGDDVRGTKTFEKQFNVLELYQPNLSIAKEISTTRSVTIQLADNEFYDFLRVCSFEAEVLGAEVFHGSHFDISNGANFSKQAQVHAKHFKLKITVFNLEPNHEYTFQYRIRPCCNSIFGKWSNNGTLTKSTKPSKPETILIFAPSLARTPHGQLLLFYQDHPPADTHGPGFQFQVTIGDVVHINTTNRFVEIPRNLSNTSKLHAVLACANVVGPCEKMIENEFLIRPNLNITTTAVHQVKNGLRSTTFLWNPKVANLKTVKIFLCESDIALFSCDNLTWLEPLFMNTYAVLQNSSQSAIYGISFCTTEGCGPMEAIHHTENWPIRLPTPEIVTSHNRGNSMIISWNSQYSVLISSFNVEVHVDGQVEIIESTHKLYDDKVIRYQAIVDCKQYKNAELVIRSVGEFLGDKIVSDGQTIKRGQKCQVEPQGIPPWVMAFGCFVSLVMVCGCGCALCYKGRQIIGWVKLKFCLASPETLPGSPSNQVDQSHTMETEPMLPPTRFQNGLRTGSYPPPSRNTIVVPVPVGDNIALVQSFHIGIPDATRTPTAHRSPMLVQQRNSQRSPYVDEIPGLPDDTYGDDYGLYDTIGYTDIDHLTLQSNPASNDSSGMERFLFRTLTSSSAFPNDESDAGHTDNSCGDSSNQSLINDSCPSNRTENLPHSAASGVYMYSP